jgi:aldose 1-epimerase
VQVSAASLTLSTFFDGTDPGFPFQLQVSFCYTLSAEGLAIEVTATNTTAARPCPFMVGWHPWFCCSGGHGGAGEQPVWHKYHGSEFGARRSL